jgi:hypothetical protein
VKACESDHAAPDPRTARRSCLASNNDWQAASITHATAQQMPVRNLIERDRDSVRLIEQSRAVLVASEGKTPASSSINVGYRTDGSMAIELKLFEGARLGEYCGHPGGCWG